MEQLTAVNPTTSIWSLAILAALAIGLVILRVRRRWAEERQKRVTKDVVDGK